MSGDPSNPHYQSPFSNDYDDICEFSPGMAAAMAAYPGVTSEYLHWLETWQQCDQKPSRSGVLGDVYDAIRRDCLTTELLDQLVTEGLPIGGNFYLQPCERCYDATFTLLEHAVAERAWNSIALLVQLGVDVPRTLMTYGEAPWFMNSAAMWALTMIADAHPGMKIFLMESSLHPDLFSFIEERDDIVVDDYFCVRTEHARVAEMFARRERWSVLRAAWARAVITCTNAEPAARSLSPTA
jgi:hypothetical protein